MARPRPLLLLLDWDGTLTTASTLPLLASVATPRAPHPALPALSRAYARHLAAHDRAYRPARPERTTVAQELAYLDALRPVEGASVGRVEAAGLFGGVRTRDVDAAAADAVAGRAVGVRAGAAGLLGRVQRGGGRVVVVSVAWSRRFIHGVLSGCVRREAGGEVVVMGDVEVRANEILADGSGRLDRVFGGADGGIWTAGDKGRVMEGEIAAAVGGGSSVPRTVYVGDSPTDLACLLKADVGICIRDEVMGEEQRGLRETLERVGVECLHVGAFGDDRAEDGGGGRLWWARDFEEPRKACHGRVKSRGERIGDERLPDDFLEKYGEMEGVHARSTNVVGGQGLSKKRVFKMVNKAEAVDETIKLGSWVGSMDWDYELKQKGTPEEYG